MKMNKQSHSTTMWPPFYISHRQRGPFTYRRRSEGVIVAVEIIRLSTGTPRTSTTSVVDGLLTIIETPPPPTRLQARAQREARKACGSGVGGGGGGSGAIATDFISELTFTACSRAQERLTRLSAALAATASRSFSVTSPTMTYVARRRTPAEAPIEKEGLEGG